jgi:hypothetical protein
VPQVWIHESTGWVVRPLSEEGEGLTFGVSGPVAWIERAVAPDGHRAWVIRPADGRELRVNGLLVSTGLRALEDKDLVTISDSPPFFFSTERVAAVEPMPERREPVECPRCRTEIEAGSPAVCCPVCRTWYHQHEPFTCWTYDASCMVCGHPTNLDAGLQWTPVGF